MHKSCCLALALWCLFAIYASSLLKVASDCDQKANFCRKTWIIPERSTVKLHQLDLNQYIQFNELYRGSKSLEFDNDPLEFSIDLVDILWAFWDLFISFLTVGVVLRHHRIRRMCLLVVVVVKIRDQFCPLPENMRGDWEVVCSIITRWRRRWDRAPVFIYFLQFSVVVFRDQICQFLMTISDVFWRRLRNEDCTSKSQKCTHFQNEWQQIL